MADPTRPEPQKIDPTRPGSKNFDPDPSLQSASANALNILTVMASGWESGGLGFNSQHLQQPLTHC